MTKDSIIQAINTRVGRSDFNAWRIGLTHDLGERKTYWKETEPQDVFHWTQWTADSLADAQEIESYFINGKGMKSGTGGDLSPSKTVYVYIF
jgi:hypothetical protein